MGKKVKIQIIGYSGGGKSTLARWLESIYHIKLLSLDDIHWIEGKYERAKTEDREIISQFLEENDSWIIDGNYSYLFFEERIAAADLIIFLNINRCKCLYQTILRYFERLSRVWKGKEEFSFPNMKLIFHVVISGRNARRFAMIKEKYGTKIVEIKNVRQLKEFQEKVIKNISVKE